jgi:hypothetical protein
MSSKTDASVICLFGAPCGSSLFSSSSVIVSHHMSVTRW